MPQMTQAETKQRAAFHHMAEVMKGLEADLRWGLTDSARIPAGWHKIAAEDPTPKKRHISIRLDEDVLKFFQAMGAGYLTRINAVLRCFMLARLAGVVKGAAEVDHGQEARAEYLREMEAYMKEKPELDRLMALGGKAGDAAYAKASARLDRIQALLLGMLDGVVEDMEQG
ncbi:BrnA antitoxin family protein [Thioclava sp. FR2]|uniref:BrnA antitoxin family protein n=1 Tax=Thioclava sp. FR2 TaxID=3445780 RepID=UPI003EBAB0B5